MKPLQVLFELLTFWFFKLARKSVDFTIRSCSIQNRSCHIINRLTMNKFKLLSSSLDQQPQRRGDGSQDQKQHRREEIHLLNILDRCTRKFRDYSEILRDDRIWIRNRVKEMDPDILAIFRKTKKVGSGARMNESELHQLQVNLRKHVNRVKEKHKQEQLVRFK